MQGDRRNHGTGIVNVQRTPGRASAWRRLRLPAQLGLMLVLGMAAPFALYVAAPDPLLPAATVLVVAGLLGNAVAGWVQGFLSLRKIDPPLTDSAYPPATALITAYLPNEAATVVETVAAFLRVEYAGAYQVILAYDTPRDLPVEADLQAIAAHDARFLALRVDESTSKSECLNAALAHVRGDFVGLFDADHHPATDVVTRAWRWLAGGADVVQGRPVVRNGDASAVAAYVAVEFEANSALSHCGRARLHGFGLFGGTTAFWPADLLRRMRLDPTMLCEDTEVSMRLLADGGTIVNDPALLSWELAPVTLGGLWRQRLRWAQGTFVAYGRHLGDVLRSSRMTPRQKLGFLHLLSTVSVYPWLVLQVLPLGVAWLWRGTWLQAALLLVAYVLSAGPAQTYFAYRYAPGASRRWAWFARYLLIASLVDTALKSAIAALGQVREAMRDREWAPTPRAAGAGAAPTPGPSPAARERGA